MHATAPRQILRQIFVALLPSDVSDVWRRQDAAAPTEPFTAIVIDTLRFTTTACRALQVGARSIQVASSVEKALQLADSLPARPLLCGERHCHKIEGFDLGNSPFEFASDSVQGRDLVFTTTNGTLAIEAVQHLPRVLLAALVNRRAVCQHLQSAAAADVLIVCAGTDGQLTWEDVLTAGAIVDKLLMMGGFDVSHDAALLARAAWQATIGKLTVASELSPKLFSELSRALGGRNLLATGYERDLRFASQLDTIEIVPQNSALQPHSFTVAEAAKTSD